MLTYVVLCITAYLVLKILRAPRSADATEYLLVSGLIPLPIYMIGRSAQASVFSLPICSSRLHRTWVQQVFASTCDTVVRPHI